MSVEQAEKGVVKADEDSLGLRGLLSKESVKARFNEVLGKEAAVFSASVLSVYNTSKALRDCDPKSILNAAFQAAALKLPITPGLGQSAIVPYKGQAQFQIMVRGFIQLAHRSGQYKKINLADVYEGQLIEHDVFTGKVKLDASKKKSDKIVGYFFYFELLNGFTHEAYWSHERCIAHGKKYSQAFKNGKGPWVEMEGAMCRKTVVKNEISKWGPLSSDMHKALAVDQATIKENGDAEFIDTSAEAGVDADGEDAKVPEPQPALPAPATDGAVVDAEVDEATGIAYSVGEVEKVTATSREGNGISHVARFVKDENKYLIENESVATLLQRSIKTGKKYRVGWSEHSKGRLISIVDIAE